MNFEPFDYLPLWLKKDTREENAKSINDQCCHYIETSQFICKVDHLTDVCTMEILFTHGLTDFL